MIVKKYWHTYKHQFKRYDYMGIFLFGFIPIFIMRSDTQSDFILLPLIPAIAVKSHITMLRLMPMAR